MVPFMNFVRAILSFNFSGTPITPEAELPRLRSHNSSVLDIAVVATNSPRPPRIHARCPDISCSLVAYVCRPTTWALKKKKMGPAAISLMPPCVMDAIKSSGAVKEEYKSSTTDSRALPSELTESASAAVGI